MNGMIYYLSTDGRYIGKMLAAAHQVYDELKNLILLVKHNRGRGTFYYSRHELIFAFKQGRVLHQNTFKLRHNGR